MVRLVVSIVAQIVVFGASLFVPAGTWNWWRAWVFLGVVFVGTVASVASLLRGHVDLLDERLKSPIQRGQPLADKVVLALLLIAFGALVIFIPLDVFWLHLLANPPAFIAALGMIVFIVGWWICYLALRENAFAAPVVKHEGRQTVVDSGVYAVVRHPMYAGGLLYIVGMCLWLESYAAALLTIVPAAIIVARILLEERFLRRELAGYSDYAQRVRYRLIPYVW
jgi:protein-S-isoprenylcysteine O-methyltransferase Ste14